MYIYIHIYTYVYIYIYTYIYTHIYIVHMTVNGDISIYNRHLLGMSISRILHTAILAATRALRIFFVRYLVYPA